MARIVHIVDSASKGGLKKKVIHSKLTQLQVFRLVKKVNDSPEVDEIVEDTQNQLKQAIEGLAALGVFTGEIQRRCDELDLEFMALQSALMVRTEPYEIQAQNIWKIVNGEDKRS